MVIPLGSDQWEHTRGDGRFLHRFTASLILDAAPNNQTRACRRRQNDAGDNAFLTGNDSESGKSFPFDRDLASRVIADYRNGLALPAFLLEYVGRIVLAIT